ncbi:hypothetical protein PHYSODRAFT_423367, partial [Phytophthora sojae]
EGRAEVKLTLSGELVYKFRVWVGDLSGQDVILGMDFMVPAGVRLDLADGTLCLPDEVRIQMTDRKPLYSSKADAVYATGFHEVGPGQWTEISLKSHNKRFELWVTRGEKWVITVVNGGFSNKSYLRITNISTSRLVLDRLVCLAIWLPVGQIPRRPGFARKDSNRYREWQTLAFEAAVDTGDANVAEVEESGPLVERPSYRTPTAILARPRQVKTVEAAATSEECTRLTLDDTHPQMQLMKSSTDPTRVTETEEDVISTDPGQTDDEKEEEPVSGMLPVTQAEPSQGGDATDMDEAKNVHEGADLTAEDIEKEMAVLPEISLTAEFKGEDLKVGDPTENTAEKIDRLRDIIWERRHLLIGKGNALPPAATGAICDIDVGGTRPVAQRCRRIPPQFREKVFQLDKGLLGAKIIRISTSPWASPIVIVVKKYGVDVRLCIDYRLVNALSRLMIYPMPLIDDLLEDLDSLLWF